MGKIIAVTGKNGSGKTTLAVNLALTLAKKKKIAVLLNGDLNVGSTQCFLGAEIPREMSLKAYLSDKVQVPEKYLVQLERENNLYLLGVESSNENYQKPALEKEQIGNLLSNLSMQTEYVVLDLPFDLQNGLTLLGLSYADSCIITTRSTTESAMWYRAYKSTIRSITKKPPLIFLNMHEASITPNALSEQLKEDFFLLPNCENAWVRTDAGYAIVESKGKNESSYRKVLDEYINLIEVAK